MREQIRNLRESGEREREMCTKQREMDKYGSRESPRNNLRETKITGKEIGAETTLQTGRQAHGSNDQLQKEEGCPRSTGQEDKQTGRATGHLSFLIALLTHSKKRKEQI